MIPNASVIAVITENAPVKIGIEHLHDWGMDQDLMLAGDVSEWRQIWNAQH
jgi:hypothetical protein